MRKIFHRLKNNVTLAHLFIKCQKMLKNQKEIKIVGTHTNSSAHFLEDIF